MHQGTVTSVRFIEETGGEPDKPSSQISILSGGADKQLLKHSLVKGKKLNDFEPFELTGSETFRNKIFSMDVASESHHLLTGHDKNLTLSKCE